MLAARQLLRRSAPWPPLRTLARQLCWARTDNPHVDPTVPSTDRVLEATLREREQYGRYKCKLLREAGRMPCSLVGDRLPYVSLSVSTEELLPIIRRTHCQREILTLRVSGGISPFEGDEVHVLPQEIQYKDLNAGKVEHVTFRRWPRDAERNPIKLAVPIIFINQDAAVKGGGYVHEMFEVGRGLKCSVRLKEHIPRFLLADMRRAVGGDIRAEHLEFPPCAPRAHPGRTHCSATPLSAAPRARARSRSLTPCACARRTCAAGWQWRRAAQVQGRTHGRQLLGWPRAACARITVYRRHATHIFAAPWRVGCALSVDLFV
jgi:ribosomal protein L25 (general stress protein Ctc)